MATIATISFEDYDRERSSMSVHVQDIGAANYGAVTQDIDEIKDASRALSIGVCLSSGFTKSFPETGDPAATVNAQRERKWLVTYRDSTQFLDAANTIANPGFNKIFNFEIPCADASLLSTNSDEINRAATVTSDVVGDATVQDTLDTLMINVRSPYNNMASAPLNTLLTCLMVGKAT